MNQDFSPLLKAREARQKALSRALSGSARTLVALSLNVPGINKTPPGSAALFSWALDAALAAWPEAEVAERSNDALGNFAVLALDREAREVKKTAVAMEAHSPSARLIDIDVYDAATPLGRRELGLPARSCLLCEEAAVDCMRQKRHTIEAVVARAHELLAEDAK